MTARDEWRWTDERGVQRLVGTDELRAALASSVLPPSTLVWREGMKEWAPAFTMPELASAAIAAARGGGEGEPGHENTPTEVDVPAGKAPPPGRNEMRTLLGLNATESKERQSAPILPIVVPNASGATPGGRDVITQLPKFAAESDQSNPAIPAAPRMPGRPTAPASKAPAHPGAPTGPAAEPLAKIPKQRQRTATMQGVGLQRSTALRTKTTSDIDSLWAAPSSQPPPSLEPDFGKPRPAAGAPAEAAIDDGGDRPSSTEVEDVEVVSERVPAPPRVPDFRPGARQGTRPPGPPPKAVVASGPRKTLSSIPPPLPKRQPSIPPAGGASARLDALADKNALRSPPTGFESRAPGMRPQAPPLPPKRGGSERPPMKSTPPPGGVKRSHPPPPLKSRAPMPSNPPVETPVPAPVAEPTTESAESAKAALDAVDVEITADALAGASSTPAPVTPVETKAEEPKAAEPTPAAAKAEPKPASSATATPAPAAAAPVAATPATSTAAAKTATPAPAKAALTPTPLMTSEPVEAKAKPAAPSAPTKTATPAPVAAQTSDAAEKPPPVAEKPLVVDPLVAASVTPPPTRVAIRDKADLTGTPTVPVAARDELRGGRSNAERDRAVEAEEPRGRQRKLGEVNVPVSSLMIAGGALIAMAMTGFLVGRSSSSSTTTTPRAQAGIHMVIGSAHSATPSAPRPCGVARNAHRWAPRASKTIPFELLATPSGKLSVGYAKDDNEAGGLEIDPATGDTKETFSKDTPEAIEHVMPNPAGGFTVIAPGESGALKNAIEVPIATPFYVGVSDGSVVSSDKVDAAGPKIWSLPGSDAINSERVEQAGKKGFGYTFRQGNDVFGGWLDPGRRAVGELVKVAGSGGSVGKPMSAFNGSEMAVIFADRPAGASHWQIRVGHAAAGAMPTQTKVIPLPKGGPGGDAFAPDIAGLPDGRWVLVWTEGPPGGRAVRAQTLSTTFEPIGDPMALSPPAGNFGQGVIGVIGDRATVVFLSKGSQSFELWGAVLQCG